METTIFTKIINNEIEAKKIFENKMYIAILDIKPENPGHTLLIPKIGEKDILSESTKVKKSILVTAESVANMLKEKLNASGIKIILNNGASSGQTVFHTHLHLIPYYDQENKLTIDEVFKKLT